MHKDTNIQLELQELMHAMPFAKTLDIKIILASYGAVKTELLPHTRLLNHFGAYQAGVFFAFCEITGGLLLASFFSLRDNFLIAREGSIEFHKPASSRILCEASLESKDIEFIFRQVTEKKKTSLVVKTEIKTEMDEKIATANLIYYLRRGLPKSIVREKKW